MTTDQVVPAHPQDAGPGGRWYAAAGWCVLATIAVLLVLALRTGEREASLETLRERIASGEVTEVRLSDGLPPGQRGVATVTIRWDDRVIGRYTEVRQVVGRRMMRDDQPLGEDPFGDDMFPDPFAVRASDGPPVLRGDVAEALSAGGGTVTVVGRAERARDLRTTAYGLTVPGWVVLLGLAQVLATLLLVSARDTWRGTRWAWTWLVLMTPIGGVAFVLLGGPTGRFAPDPGTARLTGGWAFLLALLVGAGLSVNVNL